MSAFWPKCISVTIDFLQKVEDIVISCFSTFFAIRIVVYSEQRVVWLWLLPYLITQAQKEIRTIFILKTAIFTSRPIIWIQ